MLRAARHRLGAEESGFTLIEILVAAMVLTTASLGTLQVLISANRVQFRAEQSQVVIDRAQAEMEAIRTLSFDQVALTSVPTDVNEGGPGERLASSCTNQGVSGNGCFGLNRNGSNLAPLVVENGALDDGGFVTGAGIDPGPFPYESGGITGKVYRYVVWQNDYSCPESQCPGMQDRKRVVVVATIDDTATGGARTYREVQSDFADPDRGKDIEPTPTPPSETTAQQLWLSDTTCDKAERESPRNDHPVHRTLGDCSSANAPDLLLTETPLLDLDHDAEKQPEYDLSDDVEPVSGATLDKGLQLRRDLSSGCSFEPTGTVPNERTHRWVTHEVAAESTFVLEGKARLELYTQTLGNVTASGRLCVFLFVRDTDGEGNPVDTMIRDAGNGGMPYFSYELPNWPSGGWQVASIPLQLQPPDGESHVRVLGGQRLGLAISVASETSTDALQIGYEHPDFDSRLEIETATPLP